MGFKTIQKNQPQWFFYLKTITEYTQGHTRRRKIDSNIHRALQNIFTSEVDATGALTPTEPTNNANLAPKLPKSTKVHNEGSNFVTRSSYSVTCFDTAPVPTPCSIETAKIAPLVKNIGSGGLTFGKGGRGKIPQLNAFICHPFRRIDSRNISIFGIRHILGFPDINHFRSGGNSERTTSYRKFILATLKKRAAMTKMRSRKYTAAADTRIAVDASDKSTVLDAIILNRPKSSFSATYFYAIRIIPNVKSR